MPEYDILASLETGPKTVKEFRTKFGVYPRKLLHLLLELENVSKLRENGKIVWKIDKELPKQEVVGNAIQDQLNPLPSISDEDIKIAESGDKVIEHITIASINPIKELDDKILYLKGKVYDESVKQMLDALFPRYSLETITYDFNEVEGELAVRYKTLPVFETVVFGIQLKKLGHIVVDVIPITDEAFNKLSHNIFHNEQKKYKETLERLKHEYSIR